MCPSMCTVQSTRSATLMWETFPFTSVLCAVPELHHLPNRLISNYITTRKGPSKRGDGIFFFSQGSVGRRIGSSRMEKNRKRGNDDKTQTRDAPYWFPLLLLLLFFFFSALFVNWSDVSCCVADDAVPSVGARYRTGQGKVRFRHDILSFIIRSLLPIRLLPASRIFQSPVCPSRSLENNI